MPHVSANGVDLCYEVLGAERDPAVVLVMGLGCQLVHWDDEFCAQLVGRGFRVIRFDNRDIGLSTKLRQLGLPNVMRLSVAKTMGLTVRAPYQLEDMAQDIFGLLDVLGIERAHLVGASMGGMIAQVAALLRPDRVASLCSWMSTTGEAHFRASFRAARALLTRVPDDIEARVEHTVRIARVLGSQGSLFDEDGVRRRAAAALARNAERAGFARQFAAVLAGQPRTSALRGLSGVPTLVMHGEADQLVPLAAGRSTARAIDGSRLVTFPNVGHDMPTTIWDEALDEIASNAARADAGVSPTASA